MANIVLPQGIRQNLLSLQETSDMQSMTQQRLATGKRVNSALDSPVNFFTSDGLRNRGNQLQGLLDGIGNGIKTIEAANQGLTSITKLVENAQAILRQAQSDAAQNRPTKQGTALTTAAESTLTGKSIKDTTLDKLLEGAATTATATVPGNLGVTAGSVVTLRAGGSTYEFTTSATMTVRDFVNQVNQSGIASAAVDETGKLTFTGTGSSTLKVSVGYTAGVPAGASNAALGFVAADWGTGIAATGNSSVRANLIAQYNEIRNQIGKLAQDSGFNGTNLLNGDKLSIVMNELTGIRRNTLDIQGETLSASNLGILVGANSTAVGQTNFQNDSDLDAASDALTGALTSLRTTASTLGSNLAIVQSRQDFTKSMINTLSSGADNLVLADMNEEGANLLSLNTRQQLSQTALSLSSQAQQGVLRLFQ
jgi:flagellin